MKNENTITVPKNMEANAIVEFDMSSCCFKITAYAIVDGNSYVARDICGMCHLHWIDIVKNHLIKMVSCGKYLESGIKNVNFSPKFFINGAEFYHE